MKPLRGFVVALLLLGACSGTAHAQSVTVYTSRADFVAAAGALPTLDFEGPEVLASSVSVPGVTFSSVPDGSNLEIYLISPATYPAITSNVLASNRNFQPLFATFDGSVNAVGTDLLSLVSGSQLLVTVSGPHGDTIHPVAVLPDTPVFFGVIVDGGSITRVTVTPDPLLGFAAVDNFAFGVASPPVPPDPLKQALEDLFASVEAGLADGSISAGNGSALNAHLQSVRRTWAAGDRVGLANALTALRNFVRARSGKTITAARAAHLLEAIQRALQHL